MESAFFPCRYISGTNMFQATPPDCSLSHCFFNCHVSPCFDGTRHATRWPTPQYLNSSCKQPHCRWDFILYIYPHLHVGVAVWHLLDQQRFVFHILSFCSANLTRFSSRSCGEIERLRREAVGTRSRETQRTATWNVVPQGSSLLCHWKLPVRVNSSVG